jgi:hypothetical protein
MIDLNSLSPVPPKPSYEELSVQLLDAAIDLNRIERGEISESAKVGIVLSNLGLGDHLPATGEDLCKVVDPKTIDIYSRVVSQLTTEATRNINDLAAHIQKYVAPASSHNCPKNVVAMKEFFIALHRELLAESNTRLEEDAPE